MSKNRRPYNNKNRERPIPTTPTPETMLKLVPDYVRSLAPELQQAAIAIVRVHDAISGAYMPGAVKAASLERSDRSLDSRLDHIKDRHLNRYLIWVGDVMRAYIPLFAIFDMLVDCRAPNEVDIDRRRPTGTAAEWLLMALDMYVKIPLDAQPKVLDIRPDRLRPLPARY